jgi:hypothetical protein
VPMLPIPQYGVLKDLPSFVAPRPGDPGHMHAWWMDCW